jgi:hypothetical protein
MVKQHEQNRPDNIPLKSWNVNLCHIFDVVFWFALKKENSDD